MLHDGTMGEEEGGEKKRKKKREIKKCTHDRCLAQKESQHIKK